MYKTTHSIINYIEFSMNPKPLHHQNQLENKRKPINKPGEQTYQSNPTRTVKFAREKSTGATKGTLYLLLAKPTPSTQDEGQDTHIHNTCNTHTSNNGPGLFVCGRPVPNMIKCGLYHPAPNKSASLFNLPSGF